MAQVCCVCNHSKRLQIDRELARGLNIAGISRKYDINHDSLTNHKNSHLSRQLVQAWEKKELLEGMDILNDIENLVRRTKKILDESESKKNYGVALGAIREVRESYKLLSQIAFSLHQARTAELEHERIRSGEGEREDEERFTDQLEVLTIAELEMLLALQEKINSGNRKLILIPDIDRTQGTILMDDDSDPSLSTPQKRNKQKTTLKHAVVEEKTYTPCPLPAQEIPTTKLSTAALHRLIYG